MGNFNLDQAIFPKGSNQKRLTELVEEGFQVEGPFLVKIKGEKRIVYEKVSDRTTVYILTNGDNYSTYISNRIKNRNKV